MEDGMKVFIRLPRELRDQIYEHTEFSHNFLEVHEGKAWLTSQNAIGQLREPDFLDQDEQTDSDEWVKNILETPRVPTGQLRQLQLPPFYGTDKQIDSEVWETIIRTSKWIVQGPSFKDFLLSLPVKNPFTHVRHIVIQDVSLLRDTTLAFPNLAVLTYIPNPRSIQDYKLITQDLDRTRPQSETLPLLFASTNLKKILFGFVPEYTTPKPCISYLPYPWHFVRLRTVLACLLRQAGRNVELTADYETMREKDHKQVFGCEIDLPDYEPGYQEMGVCVWQVLSVKVRRS
jgi:hypothetical protein